MGRAAKNDFEKSGKQGLIYGLAHDSISTQGGGQLRKEVAPMSITEVIALLMLVIAAISLGYSIKK